MSVPEWLSARYLSNQSLRTSSCWSAVLMPRGVDDIAELLMKGKVAKVVLKNDRTTTVSVVALDDKPDQNIVLKRYNAKGQWHRVWRAVRKTRANRCWHMSFTFGQAGLTVAQPYMMHEQRFAMFNLDAFFATQKLAGQELLAALPKLERAEQDQVVVAIRDMFERFEAFSLSHGDMKATNLLWDGKNIALIDLDAAHQHTAKKSWKKANRKDRRRFLKNWQDQPQVLELFEFLR
ncbi:MAG: lipopolysaccharide kinase InaA family protein [Arenicella sp.]|jgi:serine/threonine-protein kinase RIO1|nr:lipopolysaccharide kinase InaA family protein [Arenicella sp.]